MEIIRLPSALLVGAFCALALSATGAGAADGVEHLSRADWSAVPGALPTIVQVLSYHAVIPVVCRALAFDPARWGPAPGIDLSFDFVFSNPFFSDPPPSCTLTFLESRLFHTRRLKKKEQTNFDISTFGWFRICFFCVLAGVLRPK